MSRQVIRVGDPTSHGGKVVFSGATQYTVGGKAVALKGDPCSCPHRGHHGVTIAEGDPDHTPPLRTSRKAEHGRAVRA